MAGEEIEIVRTMAAVTLAEKTPFLSVGVVLQRSGKIEERPKKRLEKRGSVGIKSVVVDFAKYYSVRYRNTIVAATEGVCYSEAERKEKG